MRLERSGMRPIEHGPRDRDRVALTFDACMTPLMARRLAGDPGAGFYDARIVDALREAEAPATMFVTGLWAQAYETALSSFAGDPLFEIGNHSFAHGAWSVPCYGLPSVGSSTEKRTEVIAGAKAIAEAAGVETTYFRFPGGCYAPEDVELVSQLGHQAIQWDVVSGDTGQSDPVAIAAAVLRQARPGSIVVFHLIGSPLAPGTGDALPLVIETLRAEGLSLVTVSALLNGA